MKLLDPNEYVTMTIDVDGTRLFEAFLDRNFRSWRQQQFCAAKNAGGIKRQWYLEELETEDIIRNAIYRREYVEIYDDLITLGADGVAVIEYPKNILCDINGDTTPVARWRV